MPHPSTVLVPRFDAIGDLVLLSGFLLSLREAWPDARVTLLVRREVVGLSRLFPDGLEWLGTDVRPARVPPNLEDASRLLESVHGRHWDLVLVTAFSGSWAEHVVAASQPGAVRVSLAPWPEEDPELRGVLRALHLPEACPYERIVTVEESSREIEKYEVLQRAIVPDTPSRPPNLAVPKDVRAEAVQLLESNHLVPGRFAAVAPDGTQNVAIKAWPADRFVEVLLWLEAGRGLPSLLLGHVSEKARVEKIAATMRARGASPRTFLGETGDLPLLAALVGQAALYFGNDTGAMHMAGALGVPVAGVFGGGTWPRFQAGGPRAVSAVGAMPCFGCNWDCAFEDAPCVRLVTVEDGRRAVLSALGVTGAEAGVVAATTVLDSEASKLVAAAARLHRAAAEERRRHVRMIEELQALLRESQADRSARLAAIDVLGHQLAVADADRAARLTAMEDLGQKLAVSEADRAARLEAMEELGRRLQDSLGERDALLAQLPVRVLIRLGIVRRPGKKSGNA